VGLSEIGEHDERNLLLYCVRFTGLKATEPTLLCAASGFGFSFFKLCDQMFFTIFYLLIGVVREKCYALFARLCLPENS
jgi:hypothetical protein